MSKKTKPSHKRVKSSEWTTLEINVPSAFASQIGSIKVADGVTAVVLTSDEEQWKRARALGSNVEFKASKRRTKRSKEADLDRMIKRALSSNN